MAIADSPRSRPANRKQYPRCTTAYNWVKLQRKTITYLLTWDVGNVVLLYPHISGIFFRKLAFTWINSIYEIQSISRLILAFNSSNMWGLRFLSMGHLKNKVYATNPTHYKNWNQVSSIRREIGCISETEWIHVNAHFLKICQQCVEEEHFQHLML